MAQFYGVKTVGSNLINAGVDMLTKDCAVVLLVYGDTAYYGMFGFKEEIGHSFVTPYTLQYLFGWIDDVE